MSRSAPKNGSIVIPGQLAEENAARSDAPRDGRAGDVAAHEHFDCSRNAITQVLIGADIDKGFGRVIVDIGASAG